MTFVVAVFRTQFPEFADVAAYPDALILFWSGFVQKLVKQDIWGDCWLEGVSLYTAHEIVLAKQAQLSAANGGAPGTFGGVANTKTVGSASVGYDSTSTSEEGAGYWNLTNYGKQYYRLIRIFGARAIQL